MNNKRPVNLNLLAFRFPLPAITSILHRISGFFLFLAIPLLLFFLERSLSSDFDFIDLKEIFNEFWVKLLIWAVLAALIYHLIAGIKHLVMDLGIGETLQGARIFSWLTLIISAGLIVLIGVWLWLPM